MRSLTREHARRFMVRRHLLAPPRSLPAKPVSVLAVARRFGSLQFDPLEIPGARNHDLVLHARVRDYERAWCDRWLYGADRKLVEVYNKSLNMVPVEELPWHRLAWDRAEERHGKGLFLRRPEVARAILAHLAETGHSGSIEAARRHDRAVTGYWGTPTTEGRATLDALFETGRIGIARRDGNRKHYDLIERLVPREILSSKVSRDQALDHRVLTRHRAVGLLGDVGNAELWSGLGGATERRAATQRLTHAGLLTRVRVEGVRGDRYVVSEELPLLDACVRLTDLDHAVTFIPPLDPIVWDRRLLAALWDYNYIWEIYTPIAKREFGAYVLPVLYGERFVGRIEPVMNRAEGTLTIAGVWFEAWFRERGDGAFAEALGDALGALARFVGASRVVLPRRGGALWKRVRQTV